MNTSTLTEKEVASLIANIVSGDERSLCKVYHAYSRRVYAYALRSLNDANDAEQVVIDTMYEVWRQAHRFNFTCRFSTWILGIARNKILHVLRARRNDHEDIENFDNVLAAEGGDPYESVVNREHRDSLIYCLGQLPVEQRECLRLSLGEGLSLGEIAKVQGCPENTVKSRLFKARRRVKAELAVMLSVEGPVRATVRSANAPLGAVAA